MPRHIRNPNHPKKGSRTKVEPIRDLQAIKDIRTLLYEHPRDHCLFVLGINTAYRANELRSITCGQIAHLAVGDELNVYQTKTKKWRITVINSAAYTAVQEWLRFHPNPCSNAPLFLSRSGRALEVSTMAVMVKSWCRTVGLKGNYASHSLRKTWGYQQLRQQNGLPRHMVLPLLMRAFGHSRQEQTLEYLCIQADEVANLYLNVVL